MPISVTPLNPVFGARITGVRLSGGMSDADFAAVRTAFEQHLILVFPDQPMSDDEQIAFSQRLGPLHVRSTSVFERTPYLSRQSNMDPETGTIMAADDRRMHYKKSTMIWHMDATYKKKLSLCSVLTARLVPPEGGATEFASTRAAYDQLSKQRQAELEDLIVVHSMVYSRGLVGFKHTEEEAKDIPDVYHRLVQTNPVTGRKSLLIGAHASHIVGWSVEQGRALLAELLGIATRPENTLSHHWQQNELVIWCNRAALHRATPYDDTRYRRLMQRTTILDTVPEPLAPAYASAEPA